MKDTLVIYYSYTGNSKKVALEVQKKLDADILELEPKIPFSDDYDEVVREWQNNELKRDGGAGIRPPERRDAPRTCG